MSLLLNMLPRLVITFLPRNERLLISRLQSPSAVVLKPKKIKSDTISTVSPSISHEVMGLDALEQHIFMILVSVGWQSRHGLNNSPSLGPQGYNQGVD